ncbi:hypothetical protein GCM10010215_24060 [Streptomyces virginiae]|uniref:Uncharacterized protein n=1 Tax=Streptomyces virginiae TaxID=1961 RepID=A0ABQ3NWS6_STRVG|nr:hypothetical protein GCM10010215_24060 [Streptomyces virginiae]GHI17147.1 hypothetical protein Scinn_66100 [Streptomyces virginiae]
MDGTSISFWDVTLSVRWRQAVGWPGRLEPNRIRALTLPTARVLGRKRARIPLFPDIEPWVTGVPLPHTPPPGAWGEGRRAVGILRVAYAFAAIAAAVS